MATPPKFNIAPEKWWLEDEFPFGIAYYFRGFVKFQGCNEKNSGTWRGFASWIYMTFLLKTKGWRLELPTTLPKDPWDDCISNLHEWWIIMVNYIVGKYTSPMVKNWITWCDMYSTNG